jgi:hypothetical protein
LTYLYHGLFLFAVAAKREAAFIGGFFVYSCESGSELKLSFAAGFNTRAEAQ